MIGPSVLLLGVPTYVQFALKGYQKTTAKLRHLILLSRVAYRALVEMLLYHVVRALTDTVGVGFIYLFSYPRVWEEYLGWDGTVGFLLCF